MNEKSKFEKRQFIKKYLDLLILARKLGIPRELERQSLNRTQKENLSLLKILLSQD